MLSIKKIILLVLVIFCIALGIWYFDLTSYLSAEKVRGLIESYGIWAPFMFILLYSITIVLFIPLSPFAILAGALFGPFFGFIYITISATIGATISFFIARHYGRNFIQRFLKNNFKSIDEYNEKIAQNGFKTVFWMRAIPLVPFKGPNYLLGLSKIKSRDFILGTFFGVIPESLVFAYLGDILFSLSWEKITIIAIIVILLAVLGFWWRRK